MHNQRFDGEESRGCCRTCAIRASTGGELKGLQNVHIRASRGGELKRLKNVCNQSVDWDESYNSRGLSLRLRGCMMSPRIWFLQCCGWLVLICYDSFFKRVS